MSNNEKRYRFCSCFIIMAVFRSRGMGGRNISCVWGEVKCSETRGPGKPETTWETCSDVWKNKVTVGPNII